MTNRRQKKNSLTLSEQKTTATFKLMSEKNQTLEKSLKITQDELEKYREKYHEADKNHAVQTSKNSTMVFHEVLKFGVSTVFGGLGVNLISDSSYSKGIGLIVAGIVIYGLIVFFDRK